MCIRYYSLMLLTELLLRNYYRLTDRLRLFFFFKFPSKNRESVAFWFVYIRVRVSNLIFLR